jgi:hypothetical protein
MWHGFQQAAVSDRKELFPILCSWQRVSTEEDFFLPNCKDHWAIHPQGFNSHLSRGG